MIFCQGKVQGRISKIGVAAEKIPVISQAQEQVSSAQTELQVGVVTEQ